MKVIDRDIRSYYQCGLWSRLSSLKSGVYRVIYNFTTASYELVDSNYRRQRNHIIAGKVKLNTTLKKHNKSAATEIRKIIKEDSKGNLICKTTAIYLYGKRNVESTYYDLTKKNPYYKCASDMILYDERRLDYLFLNKKSSSK